MVKKIYFRSNRLNLPVVLGLKKTGNIRLYVLGKLFTQGVVDRIKNLRSVVFGLTEFILMYAYKDAVPAFFGQVETVVYVRAFHLTDGRQTLSQISPSSVLVITTLNPNAFEHIRKTFRKSKIYVFFKRSVG